MDNDKNEETARLTIKDILNGIDGISKAMLGVNKADEKTQKERKRICLSCDKIKIKDDDFSKSRCSVCKCWLRYKIKIKSQKCPLKYW